MSFGTNIGIKVKYTQKTIKAGTADISVADVQRWVRRTIIAPERRSSGICNRHSTGVKTLPSVLHSFQEPATLWLLGAERFFIFCTVPVTDAGASPLRYGYSLF
jgi:hypothetical protein